MYVLLYGYAVRAESISVSVVHYLLHLGGVIVVAGAKKSTYVNVREGATRLIFRLSVSPITAYIMDVTATPNPQVSIIMSRVVVNMNPINLAVLGCQCS